MPRSNTVVNTEHRKNTGSTIHDSRESTLRTFRLLTYQHHHQGTNGAAAANRIRKRCQDLFEHKEVNIGEINEKERETDALKPGGSLLVNNYDVICTLQ